MKFSLIILFFMINSTVQFPTHFEIDSYWPQNSVSALEYLGSAVAVNQKGNVLVLHRGFQSKTTNNNSVIPVDTILVIDGSNGKILRTWGSNKFVKPHGIELMENGDMFITDVSLHQVFKFEFTSEEMWKDEAVITLGERFVPGSDHFHFCGPADVAVLPETGEFLVADGYCNSRVVKFCKHGHFLMEFGAGSSSFGILPTPFNVSHSVALAFPNNISETSLSTTQTVNKPEGVLVFVADRNNGRIQCFNTNGSFLYEICSDNFGENKAMLLSIAYHPVSNDNRNYGFLYAINGHLPFGQPSVFELAVDSKNASLTSSFKISNAFNVEKKFENVIETPHDIAISKDGKSIFIVEHQSPSHPSTNLIIKKINLKENETNASSNFSSDIWILILCCIFYNLK